MVQTADTTARVIGHNGVEHIIPYNRYYTAEAEAKHITINGQPPKNVSPKKYASANSERAFTLDILGHGESIAVTE